jgi:site-specific recombinase XerD
MSIISSLKTLWREFNMSDATRSQQPKLLDEVRNVLRLHHYSIHTERSYVEWIARFVRFHSLRSRADLFPAEPKIEAFLTDLAVRGNVAPATQNQAMNALVLLYKRVLSESLPGSINAVRTDKRVTVPVVVTREEVATVRSLMDGTAQVVAKLLYGSGLRIMEAVRLRIKDIDYQKQGHQGSSSPCRSNEANQRPYISPLLRDPLTATRN